MCTCLVVHIIMFNDVQWETEANHDLLGYRAIWHIHRRDYGLKVKGYKRYNYSDNGQCNNLWSCNLVGIL